ncbi:RHS repeat domain-containing protein [Crocosphaera chwakensis]|uniref:Rhs family protein n=1 Tax=Crocosphaera chwakensis CCY0110 TaxID=391612 RepID=A3IQA4_9CHRO|nr:RHS repeat domain-containing protein [Crocosphaera chwakensis]EAZ91444.1 Rhs family protein [Crocosphaera chwakensis CCY0110]
MGTRLEYEYDELYRLTKEIITDLVEGNRTIEYRFDPVGNRLERIDSVEGTTTYTYDANDRLLTETLNGVVTEYQYDDDGNLIARIEDGVTQATYEWNAKGELTAIINFNASPSLVGIRTQPNIIPYYSKF